MSTLHLVRHAHAGDRDRWSGPDHLRPLSARGLAQAQGLVAQLGSAGLSEVWSSPALRCAQTVEPLAAARHLSVQLEDRLFEGHDGADTFAWLQQRLGQASLVACTHGDLVPELLELAAATGCALPSELRWAKGSTWVLEHRPGGFIRAAYLPPPA